MLATPKQPKTAPQIQSSPSKTTLASPSPPDTTTDSPTPPVPQHGLDNKQIYQTIHLSSEGEWCSGQISYTIIYYCIELIIRTPSVLCGFAVSLLRRLCLWYQLTATTGHPCVHVSSLGACQKPTNFCPASILCTQLVWPHWKVLGNTYLLWSKCNRLCCQKATIGLRVPEHQLLNRRQHGRLLTRKWNSCKMLSPA